MPLDDALHAIRYGEYGNANRVRNEVAMQAMRGQRPESDADACRAAFHATWADELMRQQVDPMYLKRPGSNWTGD